MKARKSEQMVSELSQRTESPGEYPQSKDRIHRRREEQRDRCRQDGRQHRAINELSTSFAWLHVFKARYKNTKKKLLTMTVFPLYWRMMHDLPTSLPAPRGVISSKSAGSLDSGTGVSEDPLVAFLFDMLLRLRGEAVSRGYVHV